jgi:DNA-binding response OmpR family regulator
MVTDWFAALQYRVCHVESSREAELALGTVEPDVIILDLMLPDGNGGTLCSRLKQRSAAPIISCSATRRYDDAILALQLGADDFLRKPFLLDELQERIELALRRGQASSAEAQTAAGRFTSSAVLRSIPATTLPPARAIPYRLPQRSFAFSRR